MSIVNETKELVNRDRQQELFEAIRHFSKYRNLVKLVREKVVVDDEIQDQLINRYEEKGDFPNMITTFSANYT